MAYERKNLQDHEWRYFVYEKETTIVVHWLQAWRHYLLGKQLVKLDIMVTNYFATQLKLSPKQI